MKRPEELGMTTEVIGHARFLFGRLPAEGADPALAEGWDALGAGMENMHEAEGPPSEAALGRGRFQLLRAERSRGAERDLPHPEIAAADFLVRLKAAESGPPARYEAGLRSLLEGRGGSVETLAGVQRPRSYTSHAMIQFAYARALPPGPGARYPLGVVTPMDKTDEWWRMDWMRRETFFLPFYDEAGNMTAEGHSLASQAAVPCINRRLVHHSGGYGREDGYDFVGYFEFAEEDAPTFQAVMAALRDTARNPEWAYVREGPEWWGRRVGRAAELWE